MELATEFWMQIVALAVTSGSILTRIGHLEKKVEKHNNLVERMYKVEERAKSNTHRLNNIEGRED